MKPGQESGRRFFANWLVPFILSLLPILVLLLNAREESSRRQSDLNREWLEKCKLQAQSLNQASDFTFWAEKTAHNIRHAVEQTVRKKPDLMREIAPFGKALGQFASQTHLVGLPVFSLWGGVFTNNNPDEGAVLCHHQNLRQDYPTIITGLLQDFGRQQQQSGRLQKMDDLDDQKKTKTAFFDQSRIKRLENLLGEGLSPELFSDNHRGKGFPVIFRGSHHILVWDLIFQGDRPIGGFILLMPVSQNSGIDALRLTLKNWPSQRILPGFLPVPVSETGFSHPPTLHRSLTNRAFIRNLEILQNQIRVFRPPAPKDVTLSMLGPFMGKLISL